MYYAAMEIYLITTLEREQQVAGSENENRETNAANEWQQCANELQENEVAKNMPSSY